MKKKILILSLLLCSLIATSASAYNGSTSKNYDFSDTNVNCFLNVKNTTTGEASTVRVSGSNRTMYVAVYAESVNGVRLATKTARQANNAYVRAFAIGTQKDPVNVWQSQHSVTGPDGYTYLTLFSR